jgi:hypothetical protein
MSTIAAAARTADRIDHWIRQHLILYCHGTYLSQTSGNPLAIDALGCQQLGNVSKTSTTPWRPPSLRISPHFSSNLKCRKGDRPLGTPPRPHACCGVVSNGC